MDLSSTEESQVEGCHKEQNKTVLTKENVRFSPNDTFTSQEDDSEVIHTKESVNFPPDDTFTSQDGGDRAAASEQHARDAKLKATPAVFKRRQATRHLVVQSPTDHIFSPCSQKLLQKKRTEPPKEY